MSETILDRTYNLENDMSNQKTEFWKCFHGKDFTHAQGSFDKLSDAEKQTVLAELFQKSEYQRMPNMVSVLCRKLQDKKAFEDFYHAWLPGQNWCNKIESCGQTFQQFFPAPTRVMNAVNINNPKEILSVGFTWVSSEEQGKKMWEIATANNQVNQERHDNIKKVADKISSNLYEPKSDDNLGVPF